MTHRLTLGEYEPTKAKLIELEQRHTELERRTDLSPSQLALALRSSREFITQLRAELALFEATQTFADKS